MAQVPCEQRTPAADAQGDPAGGEEAFEELWHHHGEQEQRPSGDRDTLPQSRQPRALPEHAEGQADRSLINLASQEYFGAIDRKALKLPLVTCNFKEEKDGELKIVSFYAKAARGLMARYAMLNRVDRPEGLKDFALGGYRFQPSLSKPGEWIFTRPQPAGVAAKAA